MTPQIGNPAAWDIASLGIRIGRLDPSSGTSAEPFQFDRRKTRPPLLVLVATLPAPTDGNGAASESAAILLIAEPDRRPAILGRHLVDWFGLTPTEAELAVQLANGARLEDLSARKGVRMSTLRSQLSAVLGKTGADRQAELVGLLHRLPTSRWARPCRKPPAARRRARSCTNNAWWQRRRPDFWTSRSQTWSGRTGCVTGRFDSATSAPS